MQLGSILLHRSACEWTRCVFEFLTQFDLWHPPCYGLTKKIEAGHGKTLFPQEVPVEGLAFPCCLRCLSQSKNPDLRYSTQPHHLPDGLADCWLTDGCLPANGLPHVDQGHAHTDSFAFRLEGPTQSALTELHQKCATLAEWSNDPMIPKHPKTKFWTSSSQSSVSKAIFGNKGSLRASWLYRALSAQNMPSS